MPNKAPYRHADGSNCWTKNCSRGHKSVFSEKAVNTFAAFPENDSKFMLKLERAIRPFYPREEKLSFNVVQPMNITSAGFLKEKFATTLKSEYNPSAFTPVYEPDYSMEKPAGGLWAAPVSEDGGDAWTDFYEPLGHRYELDFKAGATVAVIDSAEDYVALVQRFKHTNDSFAATGKLDSYRSVTGGSVWRSEEERLDSIDYKKLGQVVDALYLTQKGYNECGGWSSQDPSNKLPSNVSTLNAWDIPTLLIFNPKVVTKAVEAPAPKSSYQDQNDFYPNWDED